MRFLKLYYSNVLLLLTFSLLLTSTVQAALITVGSRYAYTYDFSDDLIGPNYTGFQFSYTGDSIDSWEKDTAIKFTFFDALGAEQATSTFTNPFEDNTGIGLGSGFNGLITNPVGTMEIESIDSTFEMVSMSFALWNGTLGDGTETLAFSENDIIAAQVSSIPIPAALWLFGPALLGFFGLRKTAHS